MRILENLETKYRTKAEESSVSVEESKQWYSHPCTQQLVSSLTADVLGILQSWRIGTHMHPEDINKSMLETTKLLAQCQTAQDIIEKIEEIRDNVSNEALRP